MRTRIHPNCIVWTKATYSGVYCCIKDEIVLASSTNAGKLSDPIELKEIGGPKRVVEKEASMVNQGRKGEITHRRPAMTLTGLSLTVLICL